MVKKRIDLLLVENGLADTLDLAQRLVMAGQVRANGQIALNPAMRVEPSAELAVTGGPRYVSRGGEKLEAAISGLGIPVNGKICADVGASTGGFTDCLLQSGAARVYAIDVGHGILDWKLRQDARVVVMEGTNARYIDQLPQRVDLISVDASFISLKALLPVLKGWLAKPGQVIALIKPQFEASREQAARNKGVIRDAAVHREILSNLLNFSQQEGFEVRGIVRSPLLGPKGNTEFLLYLEYPIHDIQDSEMLISTLYLAGDEE